MTTQGEERKPFLGWTTDKDVLNQQREYWGAINGIDALRKYNSQLREVLKGMVDCYETPSTKSTAANNWYSKAIHLLKSVSPLPDKQGESDIQAKYSKEVEYLYDEFDALKRATFTNIKSRYIDFRNEVIAEYLKNKTKFNIDIKEHKFGKIDRVYLEFTIGVQTFSLHDCEDLEDAQWLKVQLSHALSNLGAEISQPPIQESEPDRIIKQSKTDPLI